MPTYTAHVSPIPEDILGIDVLQGLMLQTSAGEFHPQLHVVKPVVRNTQGIPTVTASTLEGNSCETDRLPVYHEETGTSIAELVKVGLVWRPQWAPSMGP